MSKPRGAAIYYDGECPACRNYISFLRLREEIGSVRLVNLRENDIERSRLQKTGYDLDDGMVFELDGQCHHGDDAIHMMAVMAAPDTLFNRLNRLIFRSAARSAMLYPVLRAGRNTLLRILGKPRLARDQAALNSRHVG